VTASIIEACWGLSLRPETAGEAVRHRMFLEDHRYFVAGRMLQFGARPHASIASGANAANRRLTYVGVSGDGDSLSIGIGQLVHAIRRN